ncbi:MAG: protease inhibitor I42 family protein [Propionibacteriaceae bacterium]|nr:protease inhibitor I42 family protein [Propionibacteriaceae bacterium]
MSINRHRKAAIWVAVMLFGTVGIVSCSSPHAEMGCSITSSVSKQNDGAREVKANGARICVAEDLLEEAHTAGSTNLADNATYVIGVGESFDIRFNDINPRLNEALFLAGYDSIIVSAKEHTQDATNAPRSKGGSYKIWFIFEGKAVGETDAVFSYRRGIDEGTYTVHIQVRD